MIAAGISTEKAAALRERMRRLGLQEKDIVEKFIRSQGKGGQNVNKTSTCVYLKHLPTGIEVKCQRERSQAVNRVLARSLLTEKIERMAMREKAARTREIEKRRRTMRKRPESVKERILEEKKRTSEKKRMRAKRDEEPA